MHSNSSRLVLLCAILLLLVQSGTLLSTRWVEDEGWNSDVSSTWVREGRVRMSSFPNDLAGQVDVRPPLVPLTIGTSFRVFGMTVLAARLPSLIAGCLGLLLVFLIGRDIGNSWVGAAAALLLATDNFFFLAARTARPEVQTTLFCLLGLWLYYRARAQNSVWLALCAGLGVGIGFNYHPNAIGYLLVLAALLLWQHRLNIWREKQAWTVAAGFALAVAPFLLWVHSSPVHWEAFQNVWFTRAAEPFPEKLAGEVRRYSDFAGYGSQRLSLPFRIPVRIHVVAAILAALGVLFLKRRTQAIEILLWIVPNLLWWSFLVNKSPRAWALLAPVFALALAFAVDAIQGRWRRWAVAGLLLLGLTQVAGNAFLLYRFRKADYPEVARQLQIIIPPGASAYGITTFFTALPGRRYVSYDRAPLDWALQHERPDYLILFDRVMMSGSGAGQDDFSALRRQAEVLIRTPGRLELAGRVSNDFYGNLEIYRVRYAPDTRVP
jgi:4-amino-4-deoxy-L-arabinose transferase-like glycosyltransferase